MYSSSDRLDTAKLLQEAQRIVAQLEAEIKELRQSNNQLEDSNNQLDIANKQLQQEKTAMSASAPQQPQTVTLDVTELDSWLEKKVIEVVNKVTHGGAIAPATNRYNLSSQLSKAKSIKVFKSQSALLAINGANESIFKYSGRLCLG
ncbi:hypothetical protein ACEYW6_28065 [Nostoc sp. UIC 10607]|uniref:hypothetical protein n=1 Tax=Nostoc sp. UIC 10607 TaxID=3045935 RepID=UPI00399F0214